MALALLLEEADAALIVGKLLALVACFVALNLTRRWAGRRRSLPCPVFLARSLENPVLHRFNGAWTVLDRLGLRLGLRLGQEILEIGPGGLLMPAASRPGAV